MPRRHPDDEPDDTPIRRRSRKPGFWSPTIISLVAGGGILLVELVVFLLLRGTPGGLTALESDGGDFQDLARHLNAKGLDVATRPAWDLHGWLLCERRSRSAAPAAVAGAV